MAAAKQMQAVRMFAAVEDGGQTVIVPEGARFTSTDPIVKANPSMFEPVKRNSSRRTKAQ